MAAQKHEVTLTVNGVTYERSIEARMLLSDFIREELDLPGTHVGCEHGICGICTILLNGQPIRSCLMFAVQANGGDILTIEGVANGADLHPIQEAFRKHHGVQCGFCTPGQVLTAYHLLSENPNPTEDEVRLGMSSVLCRCTGYNQIIDSVLAASGENQD
jgi:aerobic-type carbon monoxide dehydrogenase small subunit (CoxS/CutS family)